MQTLNQMSEAELMAWAIAFRNLVGETTIQKTETLSAPLGDYPPVSVEKFVLYGFQRFHNDGLGGADVSTEDKCKAARIKFDQALKGIVGRTRGESVDPFMTIVLRIVANALKAQDKSRYEKIRDGENPAKEFTRIFNSQSAEKQDAIKAAATKERKRQEEKAAEMNAIAGGSLVL